MLQSMESQKVRHYRVTELNNCVRTLPSTADKWRINLNLGLFSNNLLFSWKWATK